MLIQYVLMGFNLVHEHDDTDDLTANTITMLFFLHPIIKTLYFSLRSKSFYKTMAVWNNPNSHPLFAESNARYHSLAVSKIRRLLMIVSALTVFTIIGWTSITFVEEPYKTRIDHATNETMKIRVSFEKFSPRLTRASRVTFLLSQRSQD